MPTDAEIILNACDPRFNPPIFDGAFWEVIALHHAGEQVGMAKLNQKPGEYGANEGIALASIIAAPK